MLNPSNTNTVSVQKPVIQNPDLPKIWMLGKPDLEPFFCV